MKQIGKKLLIVLLVLVCLLTFTACVNENGTTASKTDTTSDNTITPPTDNNQPPTVHMHKYTAVITTPSCTEGGYTTYTCECGDTYVADEVEALGHKGVTVTGTQASCEETGLSDGVRCSECGQWLTEQVVIAPTGHKDANGDGKCDGCSADMTSVCIHTYESVVTAPTCTEDGYTTHTCTVCGHNYVDELTAAKGHDPKLFGAIGAGCTREGYTGDLRCANCNELYSTGRVIPAGGHGPFEIRNAKAPTLTEEGYTGDTYCSFCGKCTEKGETIPVVGNHEEHSYEHIQIPLDGYDLCGVHIESDVCIGCGLYSNPTIDFDCNFDTREFDTTENTIHTVAYCWRCGLTCEITAELLESEGCMLRWRGTMKLTKSEMELLTFNFELEEDNHNYQSVDTSLREYGFCGGVYSYRVCTDCGDVVSSDVDAWACQWVEQGVDEDGYTVSLCSQCGAYRYEKTIEQTDEHCYHSVDYTAVYQLGEYSITAQSLTATFEHDYIISYTFKDGLSCENGWTACYTCNKCGESYMVEGEGHSGERVNEDWIQYGFCDANVTYRKCTVCGEIIEDSTTSVYWNCPYRYLGEDEDGSAVYECPVCGAREYRNVTHEVVDCVLYVRGTEIYVLNDFSYTRTWVQTSDAHEFEYTYALTGTTCDDGWIRTGTCVNCGETVTLEGEGHDRQEHYEDLIDYGFCGGYYLYDYCGICNEVNKDTISANAECPWEYRETTEDGYEMSVCPDCGAINYRKWVNEDGTCCYTTGFVNIYQLGEYTFKEERLNTYYNHNYAYTYELTGATCDEGWIATGVCTVCGDTTSYTSEGHEWVWQRDNMSDYGFCGGWRNYTKCHICGEENASSQELYVWCDWEMQSVDEDGFTIYKCSDCGGEYRVKSIEQWDGCVCTWSKDECYTHGEFTFILESSGEYNEHIIETYYEFKGATCEDGWIYTEKCTKCDYIVTTRGDGHSYLYKSGETWELGLCNGYYSYEICELCGQLNEEGSCVVRSWECNWVDGETDADGYIIQTCMYCGAVRKYLCNESWNGCYCTQTVTCIYTFGEDIVPCKTTYTEIRHDLEASYVLNGTTCEDGWTYIEKCTRCDYLVSYEGEGHDWKQHNDNLREYGFCGGSYYYIYCAICDTVDNSSVNLSLYYCEWAYNHTSEDGYEVYTCWYCGAYKFESTTYEEEGCSRITTQTITVKCGDYSATQTTVQESASHNYTYTYELTGETCEDGWVCVGTCQKCGDVVREEGNRHNYTRYSGGLHEFGMCLGSYQYYLCEICGQYDKNRNYIDSYNCNWVDGETDEDGYTIQTCENCGAERKHMYTEVWDDCLCTQTEINIYTLGDKTICCETVRSERRHDLKIVYVLNGTTCEDGWKWTEQCTKCDYYKSYEGRGHKWTYQNDDLSDYGFCGGSYDYRYCSICDEREVYSLYNWGCSWEYQGENEDGYAVYTCSQCGSTMCQLTTREEDGCHWTNAEILILEHDDFTAIYTNVSDGYAHNYIRTYSLHGETCDEGWTCTDVCSVCGDTQTQIGYGHDYCYIISGDLTDFDMCNGYCFYYFCGVCGKVKDEECYIYTYNCDWIDGETDEDGYTIQTCAKCGAVRKHKRTEIWEGEDRYWLDVYIYTLGEDTVTIKEKNRAE